MVLRGAAGIGKLGLLRAGQRAGPRPGHAGAQRLRAGTGAGVRLRGCAAAAREPPSTPGAAAASASWAAGRRPPPRCLTASAGESGAGHDHGSRWCTGCAGLIVNLTRLAGSDGDGLGMVVVDDAHWCDVSSLRLLAHLSAGIEAFPLTVVVAARTGVLDARAALLDSLAAEPGPPCMRPRALSRTARPGWCARSPRCRPRVLARVRPRYRGQSRSTSRELLASARADGLDRQRRGGRRPCPAGPGIRDPLGDLADGRAARIRRPRWPPRSRCSVTGPRCATAAALAGLGSQQAELSGGHPRRSAHPGPRRAAQLSPTR